MEWAVTPSAMGSEDSVLMNGWEGDILSTALGRRSRANAPRRSLLSVKRSVAAPARFTGSLMKRVSHPTMPIADRGVPRWGVATKITLRTYGTGSEKNTGGT